MKCLTAILLLPLGLISCQPVSIVDQATLGKPEMSFSAQGAELPECGLVSLIERGRATSSQNAGGGCAACH